MIELRKQAEDLLAKAYKKQDAERSPEYREPPELLREADATERPVPAERPVWYEEKEINGKLHLVPTNIRLG